MHQALDLIDQSKVAIDAGAHLDLAICRLQDLLKADGLPPRNDNAQDFVQVDRLDGRTSVSAK
jgi:hypothetical protein